MKMRCYIFDIDGTLADCSHRLHHITGEKKDWRAFFSACHDDAPISHILELAHALSARAPIICVSGRSNEVRGKTKRWLGEQFVVCQQLYMRKAGDHRPDDIVKAEMLTQVLADGWEPIMVFDDRDRVVKMWRDKGIPCCQVAPGEF